VKIVEKCQRRGETGFKVAVVGAGPAGLSAAGALACMGHEVTVYEKLPEPGGMMMFVIPSFRYPREATKRAIGEVEELGVEIRTSRPVISAGDVKSLLSSFDAVLVATGTWDSRRLGIEGEDLEGVIYALEWLHAHSMHEMGYLDAVRGAEGRVAVIGAGLSAVDTCEVLYRKYGLRPLLMYRRPLDIAPAGPALKRLAEKGYLSVLDNVIPLRFIGAGRLEAVEVARVRPSASRGEEVEVIPGREEVIELDMVIVAVGVKPTPPPALGELGVRIGADGRIVVDGNMMTSVPGIFAAGDVAEGPSRVFTAIKSGRRAAEGIDAFLSHL